MSTLVADRPEAKAAAPNYSRITVAPVTPTIGAEISGVDLRQPLDAQTTAEIKAALNKWRVVFFREQDISNDQLKTFGRAFGPLTPAHPIAQGLDDHPEIWERSITEYRERKAADNVTVAKATPPRDYKGWHIDITFVANPNSYSILHGVEIPAYGGDTVFTNLVAAYDNLSPQIRSLLDGLQAVHKTSSYDQNQGPARRKNTGPFVSLHPLVRVHPETGEKLVFFNAGVISHIVGLKSTESEALLELLFAEITRPEYQVRFRWSPKAIVMWDNQAVSHAGPIDYSQFGEGRVVRRITVAGELPKGPDGFISRPLEGELFDTIG